MQSPEDDFFVIVIRVPVNGGMMRFKTRKANSFFFVMPIIAY